MVSARRNADAARAFFTRALHQAPAPVEVTTDRAPVYSRVLEEVACSARHVTEQHANNTIEADHGRLKARLRPMRGLKCARSLQTVAAGHAFCRTSAAATTNSPSTTTRTSGPASRSTN